MNASDISIATVASVSPLELLVDTSSTQVPAKRLGGSTYSPTQGARVVVLRLGRALYILGGA